MNKETQKSIYRHGIRNAIKNGLRGFMRPSSEMYELHKQREVQQFRRTWITE